MGKIYTNIYHQIWQPLNLWQAWKQAARGKRSQPNVAAFEYNLEAELLTLEAELRAKTYQPGCYYNFVIHEPKHRLISAAPFRDRVAHHALLNIIEPFFERQFIHHSYANRVGKGVHRALDCCTRYMRQYRYVLHCDVQQFFPAIDHQILRNILGRTIGDTAVMRLIDKILIGGAGILAAEYDHVYFPGDDLFAASRPRGLPIGNLTSQHWANVYLNELDQYVKRCLKCRAYVRYVDDMVLFADSPAVLHQWRAEISRYLQQLRLTLHENRAHPRPTVTGIPFLGFIVFPTHRRLKPRNGYAFRRKLRQMMTRYRAGEIEAEQVAVSLRGWLNHISHGDTWGLRRAVLASVNINGS